MTDTAQRTINVIARHLDMLPTAIGEEMYFEDDLEVDSLTKIELVIEFEEEFAIELTDDSVDMILTVKEAIEAIEQLRAFSPNVPKA